MRKIVVNNQSVMVDELLAKHEILSKPSSNVEYYGTDGQNVFIQFKNGCTYLYLNVTDQDIAALRKAESIGKFIPVLSKKYQYTKVEKQLVVLVQEPEGLLRRAARLKARNNGKNGTKYSGNGCGMSLGTAVKNWATVSARDWKSGNSNQHGKNERPLSEQVLIYGQPDKDTTSTTGKNRGQLNPAWAAQLMGTTLEKIFFVPLATQWSNKQQN